MERFAACPEHLHIQFPAGPTDVVLQRLEAEADEMWSFVGKKANKQWIWIAMDAKTRQVIAFHVGDRSRESGAQLWAKVPAVYRQRAVFHTDLYEVYKGIIPAERHKAITKKARKTNHVERFNNTLRQCVSRLVRYTLSFSKELANHIGAIKFFIRRDRRAEGGVEEPAIAGRRPGEAGDASRRKVIVGAVSHRVVVRRCGRRTNRGVITCRVMP